MTKHIYPAFILLLMLCCAQNSKAQDPQFSQYYVAPTYLNPAFTGATPCYRVTSIGRSQWTGLQNAFNTAAISADFNHPGLRSGFGLQLLHDNAGDSRLTNNEIHGLYSYYVPVNEHLNIRFGLSGGVVFRSIGYEALRFEDQYTGVDFTANESIDPTTAHQRQNYFDVSSGIVIFDDDRYWFGIATHHLSRPEQAFYEDQANSRLPIKYGVHGGYNFYIKKGFKKYQQETLLRITPTFNYKSQAGFDQLDLGVYFIKNRYMFGLWYRGIAAKEDFNIRNNDALILQAGILLDQFSVQYSYDVTTSRLGHLNTYGSHELSLTYNFCLDWPKNTKPAKNVRRIPCPDFQKPKIRVQ